MLAEKIFGETKTFRILYYWKFKDVEFDIEKTKLLLDR